MSEDEAQLQRIAEMQATSKENVDEIANHLHSLMQSGFDDVAIENYMRAMVGDALQDPAKVISCFYSGGHLLIRYMPEYPNNIAEIYFSVHIKEGIPADV